MILVVIGWLVLLAGAGFFWFMALNVLRFSLGFSGKIGAEILIPVIPAALMSWAAYMTYPFHITVSLVAS